MPDKKLNGRFPRWCFFCWGLFLLFTSCLKRDGGCPYALENIVAPPVEQEQVQNYLSAMAITAKQHPTRLYYQILDPGTGMNPSLCSNVTVTYKGYLANGNLLYNEINQVIKPGTLIEGFKIGLLLIGKGGQIRLYIPPSLGYGAQEQRDPDTGAVFVPANSLLVFDVVVVDIQ